MKRALLKTISVQRLFLIIIILKVLCSILAWLFNSPWLLGFTVPLALMMIYILLGYYRGDDSVSHEKFADSCYYLGFIFTISSILVALLDLPSLQAHISDISVRFGAAMVSTVLGLIVRVYLVNFRQDFQDSIQNIEESLVNSTRAFRMHLEVSVDKLREFHTIVDETTKLSVMRIDTALAETAASHSRQFLEMFQEIASENRKVSEESVLHIKEATKALSNSLSGYSTGLVASMEKFEAELTEFSQKLDVKLNQITFPEDYFSNKLSPPVSNLCQSIAAIGHQVDQMVSEFRSSSRKLTGIFNRINEKAAATSESMDTVQEAILSQAGIVQISKEQVSVFKKLSETLFHLESTVAGSISSIQVMERSVKQIVEDTRQITGDQNQIKSLTQKQSELALDVEERISDFLPRLHELSTAISGSLNQSIGNFEFSIKAINVTIKQHESVLTRILEQMECIHDKLALVSDQLSKAALQRRWPRLKWNPNH